LSAEGASEKVLKIGQ